MTRIDNNNLPKGVTLDPNTGLYFIATPNGGRVRVNADTTEQLNAYATSTATGIPIQVTTTNPNTGNPQTRSFDSVKIQADVAAINKSNATLTQVKRGSGVVGNADGTYTDLRPGGGTLTKAQAEARVVAAGFNANDLQAVTPKNSPTFEASTAAVNTVINEPSNLPLSPAANSTQPPLETLSDNTIVSPTVVAPVQPLTQAEIDLRTQAAPIDTSTDLSLARDNVNISDANATRNANPQPSPYSNGTPFDDDGNLNPGWSLTEDGDPVFVGGDFVEPATEASSDASMQQAQTTKARGQSTLSARKNQPSSADWRVRLQLAPGANYLYKAGNNGTGAGILKPLHDTDGVVFPYTPSIETSYQAKYEAYDLVHSNYRGYFYKNSSVDAIQVRATFTAQDTKEAAYLLAVIHFFRSVTKMFYGQEGQAGTPPPLVYLSGLGQYQFNQHPCLVSSFNYNLPNDVDYIRANGFNNFGINLENRRNNSSGPSPGGALSVLNRLATNFLPNGSMPAQPPPQPVVNNVNNQSAINSTYVPTRMEISITLLPTQTRSQVSTEFSLKGFASGDLLKRGFW